MSMNSPIALISAILLPIVFGVLPSVCKPLGTPRARRHVVLTALILNTMIAAVIIAYSGAGQAVFSGAAASSANSGIGQAANSGAAIGNGSGAVQAFTVLRLSEKLPIVLSVDSLGALFFAIVAVMYLLSGIFSLEYMKHEENTGRFYTFFLITLGMLNGMGLSGNLMTLYLFFEALTLLSLPLVIHSMTKEAVSATFKYLFYSIAGSSLALVGFFYVYTYGNTLEFTPGGVLDMALLRGNEGAMLIAAMLAVVGFGAKAGMFPLHGWLPSAHPVAPAPASAILSGVITKAGVLAIIRYVFNIVGTDFLRGTWVQTTWMILALISVIMGSMLAYKEPMLKKRLAYSSISQVSYVLFGLFTLSETGVLGSLMQIMSHSIVKTCLFLAAGAFAYKTGAASVSQLRGAGKRMPVTLSCFTLAAIALVGIPPTSGFISKWTLAAGALSADIGVFSWLGPVVLLLSALLTAGYLLPVSISGFFPGRDAGAETEAQEVKRTGREISMLMIVPMAVLAILALIAGFFFDSIVALF